MPFRPLCAALAVLLLAVSVTASAQAGPRRSATVELVSLQAPAYAMPGAPVSAVLGLRIAGRAKAAHGALYLSADARRDPGDVQVGDVALGAARVAGERSLTVDGALPAGQAPGTYRLLACITGCVASAPLQVDEHAPSTEALLREAVASGRLTEATAKVYEVYDLFGDPRLPHRYAGAGSATDDGALRGIAAHAAALPVPARRALSSWLTPPPARRPAEPAHAHPHARAASAAPVPPPGCDSFQAQRNQWVSIPAAGGKVRVWYLKVNAGGPDQTAAQKIAAAVTTDIYPKLSALFGRDLPSDAGAKCWHGVDGAYDIYFMNSVGRLHAVTVPSDQTDTHYDYCDGTPSFTVFGTGGWGYVNRWEVAHEMMHAFQFSFPYGRPCAEYTKFDEATANWAGQYVFPDDDEEHQHAETLWYPGFTLPSTSYGGWPFALFVERTLSPQAIASIYPGFSSAEPPMAVVDRAIGSFRKQWPAFARAALNDPVVTPNFRQWDHMTDTPTDGGKPYATTPMTLAGGPSYPVAVDLTPLSRAYPMWAVTDEDVREITFKNPLAGNPDFSVQAMLTLADGSVRVDDWTGRDKVTLCRDEAAENVTDIRLILGNAAFADGADLHPAPAPELDVRDTCSSFPYYYRVLSASIHGSTRAFQSGGLNVCNQNGIAIDDTSTTVASLGTPAFDPEGMTIALDPVSGRVSGQITFPVSGSIAQTDHGCHFVDDDTNPLQSCTYDTSTPLAPGASWAFTLTAPSKDSGSATLGWAVPDASAGAIDAGPDQCLSGLYNGRLAAGQVTQAVDFGQFKGKAPFTLSFSGAGSWGVDALGRPAQIDASWDISVTLQRVNRDGSVVS